jgi:hypothetical protein
MEKRRSRDDPIDRSNRMVQGALRKHNQWPPGRVEGWKNILDSHGLLVLPIGMPQPDERGACMSCSGPCQQGKKPCPCPDACALKQANDVTPSRDLAAAVALTLAVWVVAVVFIPFFAGVFVS